MHAFFAFPAFGPTPVVAASDVIGDGSTDIIVGPLFAPPVFGVFSRRDQKFIGPGLSDGVFLG